MYGLAIVFKIKIFRPYPSTRSGGGRKIFILISIIQSQTGCQDQRQSLSIALSILPSAMLIACESRKLIISLPYVTVELGYRQK